MLYAIGRNINKYHRFLYEELQKYEGKKEEKTSLDKSSGAKKIRARGSCALK